MWSWYGHKFLWWQEGYMIAWNNQWIPLILVPIQWFVMSDKNNHFSINTLCRTVTLLWDYLIFVQQSKLELQVFTFCLSIWRFIPIYHLSWKWGKKFCHDPVPYYRPKVWKMRYLHFCNPLRVLLVVHIWFLGAISASLQFNYWRDLKSIILEMQGGRLTMLYLTFLLISNSSYFVNELIMQRKIFVHCLNREIISF